MVFPSEREVTNVIKIDMCLQHHVIPLPDLLGKFGGTFESHRKAFVNVFTKGNDNDTMLLAWFVKFKCVVLHGNVEFGKEFVTRDAIKHVCDDRQRILFSNDSLIE